MESHEGKLMQISVSAGGVPKRGVEVAQLTEGGVEGDRQKNRKFHGGPERAVCLYSAELLAQLRAEGHPVSPGAMGENLTLSGLSWVKLEPGVTMEIGAEAVLQISSYTRPCKQIASCFVEADFNRIFQASHPGQSRLYARVLKAGEVRRGDRVKLR